MLPEVFQVRYGYHDSSHQVCSQSIGPKRLLTTTGIAAMAILITALIAILGTINLCSAEGTLTVFTHCPAGSVWYAFIGSGDQAPPSYQLLTSDLSYPFSHFSGGISLKIGRSQDPQNNVVQFEFEWDAPANKVWYDLSSLDGYPFSNDGVEAYTSHSPGPNFPMCQTLDCPVGWTSCLNTFTNPNDQKSMSCPGDTNIVLGLCIGTGFGDPQTPAPRRRQLTEM